VQLVFEFSKFDHVLSPSILFLLPNLVCLWTYSAGVCKKLKKIFSKHALNYYLDS